MENIKENNKLIAEYFYPDFVHPKNTRDDWEKTSEVTPILEICKGSYWAMSVLLLEDFEQLHYHKSYDALMPVLKYIQNDVSIKIDHYKESEGWIAYYSMETLVAYADIEKVYEEVVRYIKWYNKLKK